MKNRLLNTNLIILTIFIFALLSCSDDTEENENLLTDEYKITITGIIDGDYSTTIPVSFNAKYLFDNNHNLIIHSEIITNEMGIEKTQIIEANNLLGVNLTIDQINTTLDIIIIQIEKVEENLILYNGEMEKYLTANETNTYATTSITVLHNIAENNTEITCE